MKYRREWKYACNKIDATVLNNRLSNVLSFDEHISNANKYIVHSLYFDDIHDSYFNDSDSGANERHKWRIRFYNNDLSIIRLEKKCKKNDFCLKKSCNLTIEDYSKIINGKINELFWEKDDKIIKEFCLEAMSKGLFPKIIIDYERIAYIEPISNIRITLDNNISVSKDVKCFLEENYISYPLQSYNYYTLEVKFDDILPSYISNLLCKIKLGRTAFSKYYLGRRRLGGIYL